MRRYKATVASPFESRETWHGLYYRDGKWRTVRNQQGNVIIYKTARAALDQAKRLAAESAE